MKLKTFQDDCVFNTLVYEFFIKLSIFNSSLHQKKMKIFEIFLNKLLKLVE